MLKRLEWARCGVLALLFVLLPSPIMNAQPHPPPGQSDTPKKDAPQQAAAAPSDSITVPDGTPLSLQLVSEFSSETATVGQTVAFLTYPLRINGLVVVPSGTPVSGTIAHIGGHHGPVRVVFEEVALPSGETGALRSSRSGTGKPGTMAGRRGKDVTKPWVDDAAGGLAVYTFGIATPAALALHFIGKRHERVYPAGTQVIVYINGPLRVDRGALLKLQPQPYKGPARLFFAFSKGANRFNTLYCGELQVGSPLNNSLGLELSPGTYSFTVRRDWRDYYHDRHQDGNKKLEEKIAKKEFQDKLNSKPVLLEVHEDHQYLIEAGTQGLVVVNPQKRRDEFDIVQANFQTTNGNFISLSAQDDFCPKATHPGAQPGTAPSTMP